VNVTPTAQFVVAPTAAPQVLVCIAKSPGFVPPMAMLEKFIATVPAFVTVRVRGLLVLEMFSFPNARDTGEKPRALPAPLKLTVVGLLGSESTTVRVPL
jgi:hypothetical protein